MAQLIKISLEIKYMKDIKITKGLTHILNAIGLKYEDDTHGDITY